jgi:hypothetical protein
VNQRSLNKQNIVNLFGGNCCICGYNKCLAALSFHHKDPKQKDFDISKKAFTNKITFSCIRELEKCILICANCHFETHAGMHKEKIEQLPDLDLLADFEDYLIG